MEKRFFAKVVNGGVFVVDSLGDNKVGSMNFVETRQLIQDLIAACFEISEKGERDRFVEQHPAIECGKDLPGALAPA